MLAQLGQQIALTQLNLDQGLLFGQNFHLQQLADRTEEDQEAELIPSEVPLNDIPAEEIDQDWGEEMPYDPYYDPYYNEESPEYLGWGSKGSLHAMTWTSAILWSFPVVIFSEIEQKAYYDHYDEEWEKGATYSGEEYHYTYEVAQWKKIMYMFSAIWGPMTIFGMLSLSNMFTEQTSLYIEYIVSNMMWPAFIWAIIQIFRVTLNTDHWPEELFFAGCTLVGFILIGTQVGNGTRAMYYLHDSEYAD